MNIEKDLILIKNEDKTEEIIYCSPITNGKRNITFKNNKTYTYSSYNVEWSRKYTEIDIQAVIVYEKGIPISGITKIIKFQELSYIRLIFKNGYHKLYHNSELGIQKNSLENLTCKDCFTYLKVATSALRTSEAPPGETGFSIYKHCTKFIYLVQCFFVKENLENIFSLI